MKILQIIANVIMVLCLGFMLGDAIIRDSPAAYIAGSALLFVAGIFFVRQAYKDLKDNENL